MNEGRAAFIHHSSLRIHRFSVEFAAAALLAGVPVAGPRAFARAGRARASLAAYRAAAGRRADRAARPPPRGRERGGPAAKTCSIVGKFGDRSGGSIIRARRAGLYRSVHTENGPVSTLANG